MKTVISEKHATNIASEFLDEICAADKDVLALYIIDSLGDGYYCPGKAT